ncbi:Putative amino acid ABC transporter permease [Sodalis praecaptivus]|uniref:Putative amino acid ABC transporter permease n=1 Tax=Sodalis praecaptivus TaxID=1239307 RepID=W0HVR2_9GAMM|nr:amino acid ABC transporter permease [Sodalis praecaptivus]AHF76607.1 Putative amino acid ABC transporter permease [Sodalis praecaptivus]
MSTHFDLAPILTGDYGRQILQGIEMTLQLTAWTWVLAMFIALILVTLRLCGNVIVSRAVAVYVSYHRNVPTLVQLMLWYFAIPMVLPAGLQAWLADFGAEFIFSMIALGLCEAAFFSEDLRSGLRAIPHGQMEASRALGLSYIRAIRYVIMPQAVRNSLPALINHTVTLFKNTSLAMAIGLGELTYATREVENYTYRTFETYLVATVVYLFFSLTLMGAGALLARHFHTQNAR